MSLRALLALCLALTLTACWGSNGPLMPASAVKPAPVSGIWVKRDDGGPGEADTFRVKLVGKVAQLEQAVTGEAGSGWEASYALSFDPLGKDLYLVQVLSPDNTKPIYVLMLVPPKAKQLQVIEPDCTKEQAAKWGAKHDDGDCVWSSYAALRKAAQQVARAALEEPAPGPEVLTIEYYDKQE